MAQIRSIYQAPALTQKLQRIASFPVTALVAPMGYGKTSALRHYLADKSACWVAPSEPLPASLPAGSIMVLEDYHLRSEEDLGPYLDQVRVVLVSRKDKGLTCSPELLLHGQLYRIEAEDFLLSQSDLVQWFALCGVDLSAAQAQSLYQSTEGWAALGYLALLEFSRSGQLSYESGALMETIYSPLPEMPRKLLWYLATAVDFTEEDAVMLWGSADGVTLLHNLRQEGVPLRRQGQRWHLHGGFAAYVRSQVELLGEVNRASIQRRLGRWYQSRGNYLRACAAYEAAGDWDQLLGLIEEDAGARESFGYAEQVTRLMVACPREILARHPAAQFYHARQVATLGRPELVRRWRPTDPGLAALVDLQAAYPDLEQMVRCCRAARASGTHLLPTAAEPFTLGALSLLSAYHKRSGQVESSLKYLGEYCNLYLSLSGGHGAGALEAAGAEHDYLCGRLNEAEIQAHSAQLLAKENHQHAIQIAALFTLARCAWQRGERPAAREHLAKLKDRAQGSVLLTQTAQLAEAWFFPQQSPEWIGEGSTAALELMPPAWPDYYVVSGSVMLHQGQWARLIAYASRWLDAMGQWYSPLPALYLWLYLAAAYAALGKTDQACAAMDEAKKCAGDWVMPFQELGPYLQDWAIPVLSAPVAQHVALPALSPRENQVAQLLYEGLGNPRIAERLHISVNTVKTTIRHINAKLGTTSRESLKRYMDSQ